VDVVDNADMRHIGLPSTRCFSSSIRSPATAAFGALRSGTQLRVIGVNTERALDRFEIGAVAV